MSKKKKANKPTKPKTELGQKLFAVRKQMNTEQCARWFAFFRQHRPEMTSATFDVISRGNYISKDNIRLAMDALKEGKLIVDSFREEMKKELETL